VGSSAPSARDAAVSGRPRNHLLDQLKTVPASAFEAVDVSGCMVDADSAKADCPE
jgi:hypothetical protein